jgi:hypothetical protein
MELRRVLIKKLLEACKNLPNFFRFSKISHGVCNGIVIFQAEQRSQFFLIEFIDADAHVVRQNEIEEELLPC